MPDCVAAFPSVTPVCAASIVTGVGPGRAPDPRHELVSPRRGPLRRVRVELSRGAALRHRPPADRHRLQHEPRAPRPRIRRRCSRRSTTPTCAPRARPTSCTAAATATSPSATRADARRLDADASCGDGPARAVLRRHLRLAPHQLPLGPRHAGRARPPLGLRLELHGRARPVRLPAAVAPGQRLVLAQVRPRGAAALDRPGRPASSRACARPPAGSRSSSPSTP